MGVSKCTHLTPWSFIQKIGRSWKELGIWYVHLVPIWMKPIRTYLSLLVLAYDMISIQTVPDPLRKIKSVIDRDGATCRNSNWLQTHTHKHLGLIMVNVHGFVRALTEERTDRWTDGRYQTYYLPCFVFNKNDASFCAMFSWGDLLRNA